MLLQNIKGGTISRNVKRETFTIPLHEKYPVGAHLVAHRSPIIESKPDVSGFIVGINLQTGGVLVQEEGEGHPTPVNPHGGWGFLQVDRKNVRK